MSGSFVVLKFGGSSQCKQGITVICDKLNEFISEGKKVILVISAVGKTTNNLYGIVNSVEGSYESIVSVHEKYCKSIGVDFSVISTYLDNLKQDMNDYKYTPFANTTQLKLKIISWGEILASKIVNTYLNNNYIRCEYLNAHRFMRNKSHSNKIDHDTLNLKGEFYCDKLMLDKLTDLSNMNVFVTQGFVASTCDNKLCVLTRSGSNTTAALIANAVNAEKLLIYTDVSGVYSADPRKIQNVKVIECVRYNIALEASSMGNQLIHPFSIRPCLEKHIPICIKNTFEPHSTGTIINGFRAKHRNDIHLIVTQNDVTIFKISSLDMFEGHGFVFDIFSVFNDEKIDVNIVTTSQFEITTTTNEKNGSKIDRTKAKLEEKYQVDLVSGCAIVSIIADSVLHNLKMHETHKFVDSLGISVHMVHYSSNGLTLSYVVDMSSADNLARLLHERLLD